MAQFDVYRVRGGVLGLDCQSDLFDQLPMRFVVPLRADERIAMQRLTPILTINGERLVMLTPLGRGIDRRDIQATICNLADQEVEIKAALDVLISGF